MYAEGGCFNRLQNDDPGLTAPWPGGQPPMMTQTATARYGEDAANMVYASGPESGDGTGERWMGLLGKMFLFRATKIQGVDH